MLQTILSYAVFLACPLMMLFCMKGMFGGKNKSCSHEQAKQPKFSSRKEELEYVHTQLADLQARYERLVTEEETNSKQIVVAGKKTV